ncbi:PREDICTED: Golgi apparatus protein 1-like [Priapulus caudatus]|uniref:Golgi apparatus protein 1-like n=1 Tax=Priapulus caudatus TaxID=37621 RepID=A0ABM1EM97_PRICU|nr:PREDICTED: Golgi apparatus protein 1-like [Priapulus caudatus]
MAARKQIFWLISTGFNTFVLLCIIADFVSSNPDVLKPLDTSNSRNISPFPTQPKQKHVLNAKPAKIQLASDPQCALDIARICSKSMRGNNFAVLECLHNVRKDDHEDLSQSCHNLVWNFKKNLTTDDRFMEAAKDICSGTLKEHPECVTNAKGHLVSCLFDYKENLTEVSCKQFLGKMEGIVFSDYRLIYKFTDNCGAEISRLGCGRLAGLNDELQHSQGATIECLAKHIDEKGGLSSMCEKQILRIAELQSEDFHLDRPLYFACRDDRERFCANTPAGEGKVYNCLMKHKMLRDMSSECREMLVTRQKLVNVDYKVSRGLVRDCRDDIKQHECQPGAGGIAEENKHVRLSYVLLCLETAMKKGKPVASTCQARMLDHRKQLMEDYSISPDIVLHCNNEIKNECKGLEKDGKTIHCLLELAQPRKQKDEIKQDRMSAPCRRELESLLKVADVGSDIRVDPMLQEACQPATNTFCQDIPAGDARVLICLMDNVDDPNMNVECKGRLMEIQYFIARDFRLSSRLMHACNEYAENLCGSKLNPDDDSANQADGQMSVVPLKHSYTLSCLYRYMSSPNKKERKELSRQCRFEVKRVMRQRAVSVKLQPEIEEPCIHDLSRFCSDNTEEEEEMQCLQTHLDELEATCKTAVTEFTEREAKDTKLDRIVMKACRTAIKMFSCDEVDEDDQGDDNGGIMRCLVEHKSDLLIQKSQKCLCGVEHFQLIALKNINFNVKFKESCKDDVSTLCQEKAANKAEIVSCLSTIVRNDTLLGHTQRISPFCRTELRVELLQRSESIDLDPMLQVLCQDDVRQLCQGLAPGRGAVLECLREHKANLSSQCHQKIFERERDQAVNPDTDFILVEYCKPMIEVFCHGISPSMLFNCLKKHKYDKDMNPKCKMIISKRQIEKAKDYRLNPDLQRHCQSDLPKFCSALFDKKIDLKDMTAFKEFEGKVILCLKKQLSVNRLSHPCANIMRELVQEAHEDYRLDPQLTICKADMTHLCPEQVEKEKGYGSEVEDCLMNKILKIANEDCQKQVARIVAEARSDIHVDEALYEACELDLKFYCTDLDPGDGRHMSCLLSLLEMNKINRKECKAMLQKRKELWELAAKVAPAQSMSDIYTQVFTSPARNYFLIVAATAIGIIFVGGLFCGRVTKKVRAEMKNR